MGDLRIYLSDRIVDVAPRLGRTVVFKSTKIEHEVKPTAGYDRFAVTTWLHDKPIEKAQRAPFNPDGSIFVGIPSYRDPLIVDTIKSLFT